MKIFLPIGAAAYVLLLVGCGTPAYSSNIRDAYVQPLAQNEQSGSSSSSGSSSGAYTVPYSESSGSDASGASGVMVSGSGTGRDVQELEEENAQLHSLVQALQKKNHLLELRIQKLEAKK
jgi:hypothetical protein